MSSFNLLSSKARAIKYMDLRRPLTNPSHCQRLLPQTKPVGFSNDFMVAAAGHPFLRQMIDALPKWNRRFGSKYPTVMFSTGPMFVSYQVRSTNRTSIVEMTRIR